MNAKELRIGNWVYLKSKQREYQIFDGHDIEEIDDAPEGFDAEPIVLNEYWHKKLGFRKKEILIEFGDSEFEGFGLTISSDGIFITNDTSVYIQRKIEYVH